MALMAFRTECMEDNKRVSGLLSKLDVEIYQFTVPNREYGHFVIKVPMDETLDGFRSKMAEAITSDPQFIDLHRCYQTLSFGMECDEDWILN